MRARHPDKEMEVDMMDGGPEEGTLASMLGPLETGYGTRAAVWWK